MSDEGRQTETLDAEHAGPMTEDDPKVKKPQAAPEQQLLRGAVRGAQELLEEHYVALNERMERLRAQIEELAERGVGRVEGATETGRSRRTGSGRGSC